MNYFGMTAVEVDFHRSKQKRQMVIQQTCRIPEVRVYPPDSAEGNVINDGQCVSSTTQSHRHSTQWKSEENAVKTNRFSQPSSDDQSFGDWNPFNLRPANVTAFTSCQNTYRNSYRTHSVVIQRARSGWVSSPVKTLDIVRQNLQQHINKEISEIIKQYTDKFFAPAIENIKKNNGENSVSEEHVHAVCRQILEDAKRMYTGVYPRGGTPFGDNSDSETGSHGESRATNNKPTISRKRKDSDTDSEVSQYTWTTVRKKGRPRLALSGSSGRVTPSKQPKVTDVVRKEGPKWDSSRITIDTRFIMGAKANKALGFGATRGRLYIKHPEVFKYCGDSEDKQWLYENNRMPATGGKAYMLILDDIKDLVDSVEYRNSPALVLDALIGFQVPQHMMEKIRSSMNSQRTDIHQKKVRGRPPNSTVESKLLNIPEPESYGSKGESCVGEDEVEKSTSSKSSQFEISGSGLLFDEGCARSSPNHFILPSTNVASESDFPEHLDVKLSHEPAFQSTSS